MNIIKNRCRYRIYRTSVLVDRDKFRHLKEKPKEKEILENCTLIDTTEKDPVKTYRNMDRSELYRSYDLDKEKTYLEIVFAVKDTLDRNGNITNSVMYAMTDLVQFAFYLTYTQYLGRSWESLTEKERAEDFSIDDSIINFNSYFGDPNGCMLNFKNGLGVECYLKENGKEFRLIPEGNLVEGSWGHDPEFRKKRGVIPFISMLNTYDFDTDFFKALLSAEDTGFSTRLSVRVTDLQDNRDLS